MCTEIDGGVSRVIPERKAAGAEYKYAGGFAGVSVVASSVLPFFGSSPTVFGLIAGSFYGVRSRVCANSDVLDGIIARRRPRRQHPRAHHHLHWLLRRQQRRSRHRVHGRPDCCRHQHLGDFWDWAVEEYV